MEGRDEEKYSEWENRGVTAGKVESVKKWKRKITLEAQNKRKGCSRRVVDDTYIY